MAGPEEETSERRFASYEEHTRGFGSKMLALMGFDPGKGRLGKRESGIKEPIQVICKRQREGLSTVEEIQAVQAAQAARDKLLHEEVWPSEDIYTKRRQGLVAAHSAREDAAGEAEATHCARAVIFSHEVLSDELREFNRLAWRSAFAQRFPHVDILPIAEDPVWTGHTDNSCARYLLACCQISFDDELVRQCVEEKEQQYRQLLNSKLVRRNLHIRELIVGLRKRGWESALVHKGSRQRAQLDIKYLGVEKADFVAVCTGQNLSEADEARPFESLYVDAIRRLCMPKSAGLIVAAHGDVESVRAAALLKLPVVQLSHDSGSPSTISELRGMEIDYFTQACERGPAHMPPAVAELDFLVVGGRCCARFDDDGCWYLAQMDAADERSEHEPHPSAASSSGFVGTVTFCGYGNSQRVTSASVAPLLGAIHSVAIDSAAIDGSRAH